MDGLHNIHTSAWGDFRYLSVGVILKGRRVIGLVLTRAKEREERGKHPSGLGK